MADVSRYRATSHGPFPPLEGRIGPVPQIRAASVPLHRPCQTARAPAKLQDLSAIHPIAPSGARLRVRAGGKSMPRLRPRRAGSCLLFRDA